VFARVGFSPNDSQRQAIEHLDGPLLLVAGSGSGKTIERQYVRVAAVQARGST
jgi:DNA helicase-2/ATP-dependent DNA helicase PcrA